MAGAAPAMTEAECKKRIDDNTKAIAADKALASPTGVAVETCCNADKAMAAE